MSSPKLAKKEEYLRYIEEELMIKGGRWIATFNIAIRDFNIFHIPKEKKKVKMKKTIDSLIYGGVRHSGFILSRAFAFMASPTYRVACAVIHIKNASDAKWSFFVNWMRESGAIKEMMEFEWMWLLFFGEGKVSPKIIQNINRHTSRELGLIYADLRSTEIHNSDSFIARHGGKLFHPKNLNRKESRLRLWLRRRRGS